MLRTVVNRDAALSPPVRLSEHVFDFDAERRQLLATFQRLPICERQCVVAVADDLDLSFFGVGHLNRFHAEL